MQFCMCFDINFLLSLKWYDLKEAVFFKVRFVNETFLILPFSYLVKPLLVSEFLSELLL
jgi:hypothetical protein